jgi:hypothetical protein
MPAVALFEAKNRLSELVDRVLAGEVLRAPPGRPCRPPPGGGMSKVAKPHLPAPNSPSVSAASPSEPPECELPHLGAVNTLPGNLKTAITGGAPHADACAARQGVPVGVSYVPKSTPTGTPCRASAQVTPESSHARDATSKLGRGIRLHPRPIVTARRGVRAGGDLGT